MRKLQTPERGLVDLSFSFHSGASHAGTFPYRFVDGYGTADGYVSDLDSDENTFVTSDSVSGPGVLSIERQKTGHYHIVLRREYVRCHSQTASLSLGTRAARFVQFGYPMLYTETGLDGVKRSAFDLYVVNATAVASDLTVDDRVSVSLKLKNSAQ